MCVCENGVSLFQTYVFTDGEDKELQKRTGKTSSHRKTEWHIATHIDILTI